MKPLSNKDALNDDLLKIVKGFIDYLETVDEVQVEQLEERSDKQ